MSSTSKTTTQAAGLPELTQQAALGPVLMGAHAGLLDSVKVTVSVMVGEAHLTLGELMNLKEAAVLKIARAVDTPIDVMLNGNVVARGQLVVVDDQFGVRITDIAQAL